MSNAVKALCIAAVSLILIGAAFPASTYALGTGAAAFRCPSGYVCDASLGVAVRAPASWMTLPSGKEGLCTLSFARRAVSHLNYDERLIVKLVEAGNTTNDRALARAYANTLVRGVHTKHVTMTSTTYGRSPAVVVRGLPPAPRPAVYVVVSHRALVYLLTAPGTALGASRRDALASLRFFARQDTRCP